MPPPPCKACLRSRTARERPIRAATAALPWLHEAGHVHVMETLDDTGLAAADELDIEQYLQLRGLDPWCIVTSGAGIGRRRVRGLLRGARSR